jgi:hypothetical protein
LQIDLLVALPPCRTAAVHPSLRRIGKSEHNGGAVRVRGREAFRGSKSKVPPTSTKGESEQGPSRITAFCSVDRNESTAAGLAAGARVTVFTIGDGGDALPK